LLSKYNNEHDNLTIIERDITFTKLFYLQANPIKGVLDLRYMQKIHKFIFEDVYTWAGRLRGGGFMHKGDTTFCRANVIFTYSENIFGKLREEKWLRGLNREMLIRRFSYYMGEINTLHPFRGQRQNKSRVFSRTGT
jgi:cell filamentation protein